VGIGLALFVIMLVGTPYTGASVNPARSLGPAVVEHYFPIYHWIYWLGPFLGSFIAAGFYKFVKVISHSNNADLKWARYEEANPGQQDDGDEADAATLRHHGSSDDNDGRHYKPEPSQMV
jgi:aquaporin rerated protein, other eukaryote